MPNTDRHTEFFGPDFARGPFGSSNLETAAISIATAIAQIRAPLTRDDTEISHHAQFIRDLADIIAPDTATYVSVSFSQELGSGTTATFRANSTRPVLLRLWLADEQGGGVSNASPSGAFWTSGFVIDPVNDDDKHWVVVTNPTGVATVLITAASETSWYWGVARGSRVFYSSEMNVEV